MEVRGYKVFKHDWTCRGFQYAVGETFEEDVTPSCCDRGFHFCKELKDCFSYYTFDPNNKVAEVLALGDVDEESNENKSCTNKIQSVREISWEEVLRLVNTGKGNSGLCNSGNRNSGDCNSGNWNSGNRNSGDRNSGNRNSGDWNSGNRNSGNRNSGDWNKTNFSSGCFNTEEQKIIMFDKPSDWTLNDWFCSDARWILDAMPFEIVQWIYSEDMSDEEKSEHPEHETTGGHLKMIDETNNRQIWWDELPENQKTIVKALPNFDAGIFKVITGIRI
jgi:hypothetical protein